MAKTLREVVADCTLCYHSCGTKVTVEDEKEVKVEGLKSHPLNQGKLCPKGEANVNLLTDTRCREPVIGYPQMKSLVYNIRRT
jgi:anaerobic selenocysteine-containing dehydrogenase